MAIQPLTTQSATARPLGQQAESSASQPTRTDPRAQYNLSILQAQERVSLQSGNESLSLTFRAAIDAINQRLAPELGDQAIERAYESGLDVSPEATAERIVSLTTALFPRFQAIHNELDGSDQVEQFLSEIGAGIEQGFNEAREILDGLKVLEGDIAANIDRTFELVLEGLEAFRSRMLGTEAPVESGAGDVLA